MQYSGGCHGDACVVGGQQKQLANGTNCAGGMCHGGGCDKLAQQEKPPIAEGKPVVVATGMLPSEAKVVMAQPMI